MKVPSMSPWLHALRQWTARPGLSLVVILTIGLGIGANAVVFSLIYGFLLRPFPYADPDRLAYLKTFPLRNPSTEYNVSIADCDELQRRLKSTSHVACYANEKLNIIRDGASQTLQFTSITAGLMSTLGVAPQLGREFSPDQDRRGGDINRVLISHRLWTTRYGANPSILGQSIQTDRGSLVVSGVMPPGFHFPSQSDLWIPVEEGLSKRRLKREEERASRRYAGVVRLAPGRTLEDAQRELAQHSNDFAQSFPTTNQEIRHRLRDLREAETGGVRPYLLLLGAAVSLFLLICCANLANLLLSRSSARVREFSIRGALGATSRQIWVQLLRESAIPAGFGCVLGILAAALGIRWLPSAIPVEIPFWLYWDLNPTVLGIAILLSVFTTLLLGMAPAYYSNKSDLQDVLRTGVRSGSSQSSALRSSLVVGELTLSCLLLLLSATLLESYRRLSQVDTGFDQSNTLTFQLTAYNPGEEKDRIRIGTARFRRVLERISQMPGVVAVGGTDNFPYTGERQAARSTFNFEARGEGEESKNVRGPGLLVDVSPDYFRAMGIRLLEGRAFTEQDDLTRPWTIILSQRTAQALFPGRSAIGRQVRYNNAGAVDPWATVVGVVENVKYHSGEASNTMEFYYPYTQYGFTSPFFAVRTAGVQEGIEVRVRQAIQAVDPGLPMTEVRSLEALVENSLWRERLWGSLLAGFAVLSLFLAVLGIYAVVSFDVSLRLRELGIRAAIGAQPSDLIRLITGRTAVLLAIGLGLGLAAYAAVARSLGSLLFDVQPWDPIILLGAPGLLCLVAFGATLAPALRAARVSPVDVLRLD